MIVAWGLGFRELCRCSIGLASLVEYAGRRQSGAAAEGYFDGFPRMTNNKKVRTLDGAAAGFRRKQHGFAESIDGKCGQRWYR